MKIIRSVRIEKFRSLYDKSDIECDEVTVFSGKNNSGKSNVLKALNLFFNNESSYDSPYDHGKDFNIAFTGHMPGKREIVITVNFYGTGSAALRSNFSITRRFGAGVMGAPEYHSTDPAIEAKLYPRSGGEPDGNVLRQFTTFKNKTTYIYVPAVRDKFFVARLFKLFEMTINGNSKSTFDDALSALNGVLEVKSAAVSNQFKTMMNLATKAKLSTSPSDVLDAIGIEVESGISVKKHSGEEEKQFVDLFSTGDGILMSYVPHFLNYIAQEQGNRIFVWGFEEPENSLEYSKTQLLADKFAKSFIRRAQIFLTTHSPAFIKLEERSGVKAYRVYIDPEDKKRISRVMTIQQMQAQLSLLDTTSIQRELLASEIGMTELAREIEQRVRQIQEEKDRLQRELATITRPVVFSEGNNSMYLEVSKTLFDPGAEYDTRDGGGDKELKNIYQHYIKNPPAHKVVILWDPECQAYADYAASSMVLPLVLSRHPGNTRITKGIESCMPEVDILGDKARFYRQVTNEYGASVESMDKNEVAKYFCHEQRDRLKFQAFENTIASIKSFLDNSSR